MKNKDINIYNLFSATYKRKMFSFMGFGELSIMPKVDKPIRQISNVYQFPIKGGKFYPIKIINKT